LRKRPPDMPKGVPTVVDSIFQGQLSETLTCKCCSKQSPRPVEPFYDLSLKLPPKGHPTRSIAPPRSSRRERKDIRDLFQQIRKEGKFTCSCTLVIAYSSWLRDPQIHRGIPDHSSIERCMQETVEHSCTATAIAFLLLKTRKHAICQN